MRVCSSTRYTRRWYKKGGILPAMPKANPIPGSIAWQDLTVPDAEAVRDFYEQVVGWKAQPVEMGGYSDYNMILPGDDKPVAGVCHARGSNTKLPAMWLMYVIVEDIAAAVAKVESLGGEVLDGPRKLGGAQFACVKDPAGAAIALYQPT